MPIVKVEEVGGEESTGEEGQVQKDGEEDEKEEEEEVPERELSPGMWFKIVGCLVFVVINVEYCSLESF